MNISSSSFIVRTIAFFKFATLLIKKYHHVEGEYDGLYYGMHHVKNSSYYKKYKDTFLVDLKSYNPQDPGCFIKFFLRNVANFFISISYFPIYTHYYAIRGIILQFKFLVKEMKSHRKVDTAQKLEFNGLPHLIISFVYSPINFLLNCFFIEPLERFLYSFICVSVLQLICLLKLLPYVVLIVVSPFVAFIGVIWVAIRIIYKFLVTTHKVIFKKIKVA